MISRFEYTLPNGQNLMHNYRHGSDLSADGKQMTFVAGNLASPEAGSLPARQPTRSIT